LHADARPRRISLPTYPFAQQSCWAPSFIQPIEVESPPPREASSSHQAPVQQTLLENRPLVPSSQRHDAITTAPRAMPVDWTAPTLTISQEALSAATEIGRMEDTRAVIRNAQFGRLGLYGQAAVDVADWMVKTGLPRSLARWLPTSLDALVDRGVLFKDGESWRLATGRAVPSLEQAWREWDASLPAWEASRFSAHARLLDATLRALPDILSGRRAATAVMFPQGSMQLVEGVYRNNLVADHFNAALAESLMAYVKARLRKEPAAQLRILEIGAGTGGTSALLFDHLAGYAANVAEYCYTDISPSFLLHAKEHFSERAPYLQTKRLNIEQAPASQGFEHASYDIVLATNVLHATRKMDVTLRHAKALLKGGGLIFINEITGSNLFTHLTFGLLEGWWLHEDGDLRVAGSPALSPEGWRRALLAQGYEEPLFPAKQAHDFGQQIVVAASDGHIHVPIDDAAGNSAKAAQLRVVPTDGKPANFPARGDQGRMVAHLRALIAQRLGMPVSALDPDESLGRYGLDSISGAQITTDLRADFGELSGTLLFEYNSVTALAEHLVLTRRDLLDQVLAAEDEAVLPAVTPLIEPSTSTVPRETMPSTGMRNLHAVASVSSDAFDARLHRDVLERLAQGRLDVDDALALTA